MEHIPAKTVAIASAAQAQNMASKCLKVPGVKLINQRTVGELFLFARSALAAINLQQGSASRLFESSFFSSFHS